MKRKLFDGHWSNESRSVPGDQLVLVSSDLAESLCQRFRHGERELYAIEEMVERMMLASPDSSTSVLQLREFVTGISWLPRPSEIRCKYPVFLPAVELAIRVGKCRPLISKQIRRPWRDDLACGFVRFFESDIIWFVEAVPHRREEEELLETRSTSSSNGQHLLQKEYVLFVWISVLGEVRDIAALLEQSMLFSQPELYCYHRYGIGKPRVVSGASDGEKKQGSVVKSLARHSGLGNDSSCLFLALSR